MPILPLAAVVLGLACGPAAPPRPTVAPAVSAPAPTAAPVSAAPAGPRVEAAGANEQVTVGLNAAPPSLEPTTGVVSWHLLQLGLGETLGRVNRDGVVEPWLASSWRQRGEREWEIVLRDGLTFYDGRLVGAEAVKKSIDRSLAKLPQVASLANVETVLASDPRTLTVRTRAPNPAFGSLLAHYNLVIHDADLAESQPDRFAADPMLTGAYRPTEFRKDSGVKLVRNERYWGEPARVGTVDVRFIVDANTRLTALLSKQVDLAYQLGQESVGQVERQAGLHLKSVTTGYQYFVILNVTKPQFADRTVRQLLNRAVDRAALAERVLRGGAEPARAAFPPIFPFALGPEVGYAYEPDAVRSGLDAAGWRVGPDGVRAKDGVRLGFTLLSYPQRPELGQLGVALQAQLKEIGAAVELRQVDQINDALKDAAFDASLYANNTAPTGEPGFFLSSAYKTGGAWNYGRFSSPAVDELIGKLEATADPAQRIQMAKGIQQAVLDEAPVIYLVVPKFRIGLTDRLREYEPFPSDYYVIDNRLRVSP